jgi:hypothetical protein
MANFDNIRYAISFFTPTDLDILASGALLFHFSMKIDQANQAKKSMEYFPS